MKGVVNKNMTVTEVEIASDVETRTAGMLPGISAYGVTCRGYKIRSALYPANHR